MARVLVDLMTRVNISEVASWPRVYVVFDEEIAILGCDVVGSCWLWLGLASRLRHLSVFCILLLCGLLRRLFLLRFRQVAAKKVLSPTFGMLGGLRLVVIRPFEVGTIVVVISRCIDLITLYVYALEDTNIR